MTTPTPPVDELRGLLDALKLDAPTATDRQWTDLLTAALNIVPVVTALRADLDAAREALGYIAIHSKDFRAAKRARTALGEPK